MPNKRKRELAFLERQGQRLTTALDFLINGGGTSEAITRVSEDLATCINMVHERREELVSHPNDEDDDDNKEIGRETDDLIRSDGPPE